MARETRPAIRSTRVVEHTRHVRARVVVARDPRLRPHRHARGGCGLARPTTKAAVPVRIERGGPDGRAFCRRPPVDRPTFDAGITFEEFAAKWTSGELHRLYPKRVRAKRSATQDAGLLRRWVFPRIGRIPLPAITYDDCEDALDAIPETRSVFLVRQVAQAIARVLRLAVHPARLLKDCPVPRGFVPPILKERARTYLFPEEDRRLLACTRIALVKRLLYGVLDREGLRVDEALSLDLSDCDLKNGAVSLDRNKTNDPRWWALHPGVTEALHLWVRHFHPNPVPNARVFVLPRTSRHAGRPLRSRTTVRADVFREELERAGCVRSQLFENNEDRKWMCLHDLRATFVTISLATHNTETWVADRTGHRSSKMIAKYRRLASCHRELNLGPLDSLVDAIPELRALRDEAAE
jgi:integrase